MLALASDADQTMIARRLFDVLALAAAASVVAAHVFVVETDEGKFSWHPLGNLSIFVAFLCLVTMVFSAAILVVRRGRSWPALLALAVAGVEMMLLFTG